MTTESGTTLSTHVLDAALGRPATGMHLVLDTGERAVTDDDGRVRFDAPVAAGSHTLTFATGSWFAAQQRDTFFPSVQIGFEVDGTQPHVHVALLLSPYAYTTYRGS